MPEKSTYAVPLYRSTLLVDWLYTACDSIIRLRLRRVVRPDVRPDLDPAGSRYAISARLRQSPRWERLLVFRWWLHGVRGLAGRLGLVVNDLLPALSWRLRRTDFALRLTLRLRATRNTTRRSRRLHKTRELGASARELRSRTTLRRLRIFPPILLFCHDRILPDPGSRPGS